MYGETRFTSRLEQEEKMENENKHAHRKGAEKKNKNHRALLGEEKTKIPKDSTTPVTVTKEIFFLSLTKSLKITSLHDR